MADSASENISKKSTEKIGQAFLMSSRDELFLYELYIKQGRLFLVESESPEPSSRAYDLKTMYVVTHDTWN